MVRETYIMRGISICTFHQITYFCGGEIKEDIADEKCSKHGRDQKGVQKVG
jgi:hypothetical protein